MPLTISRLRQPKNVSRSKPLIIFDLELPTQVYEDPGGTGKVTIKGCQFFPCQFDAELRKTGFVKPCSTFYSKGTVDSKMVKFDVTLREALINELHGTRLSQRLVTESQK